MNVYRSSPPLPSIFRPSYLVSSAHAEPLPNSEDSLEIEGFSSDDETTDAEAGESAGNDDRAHSPSRSEDTRAGHPTGTRSTVWKRSSSSQTTSNRQVTSSLQLVLSSSICWF